MPHTPFTELSAKARRRGQFSWALFDWANQPYFTLITTFIFAPYFAASFIGDAVRGQELWGYTQAMTGVVIAVCSPILGGIADRMGRRKPWVAAFGIFYMAGNLALWLAAPDAADQRLLHIFIAVVIAGISAEFMVLFLNAMLPDLVTPQGMGKLSGFGWGLGYVGGLLSLVIVITVPQIQSIAGQLVGPLAAVWFLVFTAPFFLFTPDRPATGVALRPAISGGLRRLVQTFANARRYGNVMRFLIAFMIYNDGLSAVFSFGGIYAASLFGWDIQTLGLFGVILIVFAAIGAFIGGWADDRFGSRRTVLIAVAGLLLALLGAISIQPGSIFFGLTLSPPVPGAAPFSSGAERAYLACGILLGIFGGPAQAASRTLLARLAPRDMVGEFFGLYAVSGKATSFLAPLSIALVTGAFASQRIGMAVILVFLAAGFVLLLRVREPVD